MIRDFLTLLVATVCLLGLPVHAQVDSGEAAAVSNPMGHIKSLYFENNTLFGVGPAEAAILLSCS